MPDHEAPLRICLLGGFRAERVDMSGPVGGWQRRSAKTLTKLLATSPAHAMHREQVIAILWPELDLVSALNGLGKALHAARRALEPELPPRRSSQYLRLADSMISLNPQRVVVDADCFEELAEHALRSRSVKAYESALAAYGGELLPEDRYEDWCEERRRSLSELHVRALLGLAEVLEGAGAYDEAAGRLREALEQDTTREEVHRRLIRVYAQMGLPDRALRQFHLCRDALRRELGLVPQEETLSLYNRLLEDSSRRVDQRAGGLDHPAATSANARSGRTPFVGRDSVLQALRIRLASAGNGHAGLIILTGEQGVGKTRLLSEFAAEASAHGATVLSGGSGGHVSHPTSGPFAIALERYVAARSEADRVELARRHPGLARWLPSLYVDGHEASHESEQDLPAAVATLLTELARQQPVLVLLGDVGGSDPLSLDLLSYLAALATSRRWLLVASLRQPETDACSASRRVIDRLVRERLGSRLELRCLSRPRCDELLRALLPGGSVDDELLEAIYRQSGGNPLFVEELVRDARESKALRFAGGGWHRASSARPRVPRGIRRLVATRIGLESEPFQRVLALAAVTRRNEFSLAELRAGAAALEPDLSDCALLDALDRALQMGVLEEREAGYAFRHPLIRSALYEELSRDRRNQLRAALDRERGGRRRGLRVAAAG